MVGVGVGEPDPADVLEIDHRAEPVLRRVLFGVTAGDPAPTGAASGVLLAAPLTACTIPVLRAASTGPRR